MNANRHPRNIARDHEAADCSVIMLISLVLQRDLFSSMAMPGHWGKREAPGPGSPEGRMEGARVNPDPGPPSVPLTSRSHRAPPLAWRAMGSCAAPPVTIRWNDASA
jgi:hypothetical protein